METSNDSLCGSQAISPAPVAFQSDIKGLKTSYFFKTMQGR